MPGLIENSLVGIDQAFETLGAAAEQAKNQYLQGAAQQAGMRQNLDRLFRPVGTLVAGEVANVFKSGKPGGDPDTPEARALRDHPQIRDAVAPGRSSLLGSIFRSVHSGLTGSPPPSQPTGVEQIY